MSKQDIINYVMDTPHNINPAILNQKLGEMEVQPDWNQNDPTAPDYVKNKPFYSEKTKAVEVQVNGLTNTKIYGSNGSTSVLHEAEVVIASMNYIYGEEYTINIGGAIYNMNLTYQYDNGIGGYRVGFNLKQGVEIINFIKFDSAHPFCLAFEDHLWSVPTNGQIINGELHCYLPSDSVLPVSVKISAAEIIKKIDPKFLPKPGVVTYWTTSGYLYRCDESGNRLPNTGDNKVEWDEFTDAFNRGIVRLTYENVGVGTIVSYWVNDSRYVLTGITDT